jgi:hypothetical protein
MQEIYIILASLVAAICLVVLAVFELTSKDIAEEARVNDPLDKKQRRLLESLNSDWTHEAKEHDTRY